MEQSILSRGQPCKRHVSQTQNPCKTYCWSSISFSSSSISHLTENASIMSVYRSLKTLIRKTKESRTFITATTYSISAPPLAPVANPFFPLPSRFLSPLSNLIIPLQGPLFLSFPPCKLSQSATPLYLQGNGVALRKIEALNLNLVRKRTSFPLKLKFGSISSSAQNVPVQVNTKEENNEFVQSLVNLPNLISTGRLISGPVLGWYASFQVFIFDKIYCILLQSCGFKSEFKSDSND